MTKEFKCPYCEKMMDKRGIWGHLAGSHPDKEAEYRTNNPPKKSNLKPKEEAAPVKAPEYDYSEERKGEENYQEVEEPAPAPAPAPEPKPEVKPALEVKKEGDEKPKGGSFLSKIWNYDIKF